MLLLVELGEGAGFDQLVGEPLALLVGAVSEDHPVRLGQLGNLLDPGQQALVLRRGGIQTGNRSLKSSKSPAVALHVLRG